MTGSTYRIPDQNGSLLHLSDNRRHTISLASGDRIIEMHWPEADMATLERQRSGSESLKKPSSGLPHHVFDSRRKRFLVYIVSFASFFSPMSSYIYFPALGAISQTLDLPMVIVSLTVTSYMIVQAVAPSFWGPLSDVLGRRQVLISILFVYMIANIILASTKTFSVLLAFRCLQAAGSAATISIGSGVIDDITTSSERAEYMGIFGGIRIFGQSIGPILGGVLTHFFGFHAIFLALTIQPYVTEESGPTIARKRMMGETMISPLRHLLEKDIAISLSFGAIVYAIWSMVTATTTDLLQQQYGLNSLETGLAFIPNGLGCVFGSYITGIIMDQDHRRTVFEYCKEHDMEESVSFDARSVPDFPIERARLRSMWYIVLGFIFFIGAYGFSLTMDIYLPLALQFFIAYTATAVFSINSTLIHDLIHEESASATATNNLVRCSLGGLGVAAAHPLIDWLTPKFAFLSLAIFTVVFSPLLVVELTWGPKWRVCRETTKEDRH